MNNRLMIRLIDVALIILLGFIAISQLKTQYVALPSGGKAEAPKKRIHESDLYVYRHSFLLNDSGRKSKFKSLAALEKALARRKYGYAKDNTGFVLNIQAKKSSIMQNLVDVLDVCQRHKIEKNLNYEINN